ncbi:MAG: superfamily II DNA or RNA helicase/HKD family nuclease [Psychroserpens sp.]
MKEVFFNPIYFPNEIDIVEEVFLPISKISKSFDAMSGYFSSELLKELALPLSIIYGQEKSPSRLLISPNLSEQDSAAILEAHDKGESILKFINANILDEESFNLNAVDCLKYLIASGKMEIKVVVMRKGMFHSKAWLFETTNKPIAIHGSSNATKSGMKLNFEQVSVSDCRKGEENLTIYNELKSRFVSFWNGSRDDSLTINFNEETIKEVIQRGKNIDKPQQIDELITMIEGKKQKESLCIPEWLNYRSGEYEHQGAAVDAWLSNENRGIMSIATGGGKTLTSLTSVSIALNKIKKALIVIAVPTKPLIKQWASDVENFNIVPLETAGKSSKEIVRCLKDIKRYLRIFDAHKVIILTHSAIKNTDIQRVLSEFECEKVLIADEAHNLGAIGFITNPPTFFNSRLALSATIERQYDEEGTAKLKEYFGGIVFEFSVEEAIGKCLVHFDYFVHRIYLNESEVEKWIELSHKIKRLYGFGDTDSIEKADLLAIRRRAVAENAKEKINTFELIYKSQVEKEFTLVFCTDKDKEQLDLVNDVLRRGNIRFHQITAKETSSNKLSLSLINDFKCGELQVLTSKRVLDEGFNIPPIKYSYIVSSNGVERQWLQRLGRVLRQSNETGKTHAVIHDFIVIPPNVEMDPSLKTLISNEIARVIRFTELSRNGGGAHGSLHLINDLTEMLE